MCAVASSSSGPLSGDRLNTSLHTADELRAIKCSLLVSGIPQDLPVHSKDVMLEPFQRAGGCCKWIVGDKVLVVFSSEAAMAKGLKVSRNALLLVEPLEKHTRGTNAGELAGELPCSLGFQYFPAMVVTCPRVRLLPVFL